MGSHGGDTRPNRVGNNRKADAAEREDEKWVRTEANKGKSVADDEESMMRKTMQNAEARKELEGLVVIEELAKVEVNQEEDEWRT